MRGDVPRNKMATQCLSTTSPHVVFTLYSQAWQSILLVLSLTFYFSHLRYLPTSLAPFSSLGAAPQASFSCLLFGLGVGGWGGGGVSFPVSFGCLILCFCIQLFLFDLGLFNAQNITKLVLYS